MGTTQQCKAGQGAGAEDAGEAGEVRELGGASSYRICESQGGPPLEGFECGAYVTFTCPGALLARPLSSRLALTPSVHL